MDWLWGDGGDVAQVVQNDGQALLGDHRLQGGEELFGGDRQQGEEKVDAHQQGEQGQNEKIGQGGRRPGHSHPVVGLFQFQSKGNRRKAEQARHMGKPPLVAVISAYQAALEKRRESGGKQKAACGADGFLSLVRRNQASLFSLMVMLLFLLAALFLVQQPLAAALSTAFTATL